MKFNEYKNIKAINATFLKACNQGLQQGYDSYNNLLSFSPASIAAMNLGSAVHCYLLEPHLFDAEWCVSEKFDMRTTAGKEAKKAFDEKNTGKNCINEDEFSLIKTIKSNCYKIESVKNALDNYDKEQTIEFMLDGLKMKARIDIVSPNRSVIIDLKTTKDASPRAFTSDLVSMGYDIQMLHYTYATMYGKPGPMPHIFVIAAETNSGEIASYNIDNVVYSDYTKNRYNAAIKTALTVMELKERPMKYSKDIQKLDLPSWTKWE